jgi:protein SCO1/2
MSLTVGVVLLLAGCGDSEKRQSLVGYQLEPAPQVADLSLPDVTDDDAAFAFQAAPGGMLLVFFGYTSCPDICPTTLATIAAAMHRLGPDLGSKVTVAMITVDPTRDTPARLAQYVDGSVADGHGLRSDDDSRLREVATRFGADYVVDVDASGATQVSHTSTVFVVDDSATVALAWQFGVTAKDMENDLRLLLGTDR